jgi:antitoxin VapB
VLDGFWSIDYKIYIFDWKKEASMVTAKLFKNGQSQAVRLPKEFRFEGQEVYIRRIGRSVLLVPKDDPWREMADSLEKFSDDFMGERKQPDLQERNFFE